MADITPFIALASLISSILSFVVSGVLLYDWKRTRKQQRLEWGVGMLTYAMGHFIFFLMNTITSDLRFILLEQPFCEYVKILPGCSPHVEMLWLWIYINLGGAITMSLFLKGLLPLFTQKSAYIYGIPISFALIYGIGSFLYGFILPPGTPLNFIMLGTILNQDFSQKANMSWFIVECLIPVSFIIGFLFIMHYKETKARPSLLISMHFFGYTLLLFIWPFSNMKLLFYVSRTVITTILAIGFIDLIRRTEEY